MNTNDFSIDNLDEKEKKKKKEAQKNGSSYRHTESNGDEAKEQNTRFGQRGNIPEENSE